MKIASGAADHFFERFDQPRTPGLMLVLFEHGEVIHRRGFGRSSVEHDIPWSDETATHLASLSKHITAATLIAMHQARVLDLEAPIRLHLPELPRYADGISLRHLLTNTSGMHWDESLAWLTGCTTANPATRDYLFRLLCAQPAPLQSPGTGYLYNDSGFRLAVRAAERAAGRPFDEIARKWMFGPLGMSQTRFLRNDEEALSGMATTYRCSRPGEYRRYFGYMESDGDGGVVSTPRDMIEWVRAWYDSSSPMAEVFAALRSGRGLGFYGYGLEFGVHRGHGWCGHTGATFAYTGLHHFRQGSLAVLFLGNRSDLDIRAIPFEVFDSVVPQARDRGDATPYLRRRARLETRRDLDPMDGVYVCENGFVIELERTGEVMRLLFLSSGAYLCEEKPGHFEAREGALYCKLAVESSRVVNVEFEPGRALVFRQASAQTLVVEEAGPHCGHYYSVELGAALSLEYENAAFRLRIAQAATPIHEMPLVRLSQRVFLGCGVSILLLDTLCGEAPELLLHRAGATGIRYRLVSSTRPGVHFRALPTPRPGGLPEAQAS